MKYNPSNWYWVVSNRPGVVFSSAAAGYVATTNAAYTSWQASGGFPTNILSDGELSDVLTKAGQSPSVVAAAGWTSMGNVAPQDAGTALMAAGFQLTSTGTPALNGIYAIDKQSQQLLTSEVLMVQTAGKFSNGSTTRSWSDAAGTQHTFTITQFIAFAEAVASYVDGIYAGVSAIVANQTPTWPSPVTIA